MADAQEKFDAAMLAFSQGAMDAAIAKFQALLAEIPDHFDAQLALGMAFYRQGDYAAAIREGLKAEQLQPMDPLVHTNLSLFYQKAGDKPKAEYHGAQARSVSSHGAPGPANAPGVHFPKPLPPPLKFPEQPWKKAGK